MEKQKIYVGRMFLIAGAHCAYMIGSGLATGQEILQFFTSSGWLKGILAAVFGYMVVMLFTTNKLYGLGNEMQFKNPYDVFVYYCGEKIGKIYAWVAVLMIYTIYIMMLGGAGATIHQYFGPPIQIGTFAIALAALLTAMLGVEKLLDIIGTIGPIKVLFLLIMGIAAIVALVGQPNLLTANGKLLPTAGFMTASNNWYWSGILYALNGVIFAGTFYILNGQSAHNVREAKLSGMIGTVACTITVVMLTLAESIFMPLIIGKQVPTLTIASHISSVLGVAFAVLIIVCIYSAVSSSLLVVVRKFATDKTKKFNILAIVLTALGMFFGQVVPFDKLVNILMPLQSYAALLFFLFMIYKEFINKNAFPYNKNDKKIVENNGETF